MSAIPFFEAYTTGHQWLDDIVGWTAGVLIFCVGIGALTGIAACFFQGLKREFRR